MNKEDIKKYAELEKIKGFTSGTVTDAKKGSTLHLDLDISVRGDNTFLNKCITNDWPAPLLMDVLQTISTKVSGYYNPPKSTET